MRSYQKIKQALDRVYEKIKEIPVSCPLISQLNLNKGNFDQGCSIVHHEIAVMSLSSTMLSDSIHLVSYLSSLFSSQIVLKYVSRCPPENSLRKEAFVRSGIAVSPVFLFRLLISPSFHS